MSASLMVHIAGGSLAILSGFVALFAAKGAGLHRRSGMVFFYSMVVLSVSGAGIAAIHGGEGSVVGGLLAGYLVTTALTTVRPPSPLSRRVAFVLMSVGFATGIAGVAWGVEALATPAGNLDGIPAFIFLTFGAIALLGAVSDARVLRRGPPQGTGRLIRHLWRMCFALYIASGSFFLGQADELPEALRIPALLAVPAFLPLVAMFYWLWRVRRRRTAPHKLLPVGARQAA